MSKVDFKGSWQDAMIYAGEQAQPANEAPVVSHTIGVAAVDAEHAEAVDIGFVSKSMRVRNTLRLPSEGDPDVDDYTIHVSFDDGDSFEDLGPEESIGRDLAKQTIHVYGPADAVVKIVATRVS